MRCSREVEFGFPALHLRARGQGSRKHVQRLLVAFLQVSGHLFEAPVETQLLDQILSVVSRSSVSEGGGEAGRGI